MKMRLCSRGFFQLALTILAITVLLYIMKNLFFHSRRLRKAGDETNMSLDRTAGFDEDTSEMLYRASLLENDRVLSPPSCDDDVYLLVIVVSEPGHFSHRVQLRETVRVLPYRGKRFRIVFITSRPKDPNTDAILHSESLVYNDIIQASHWNAYRNMTYTALESLKWTMTECGHVKFLLKIDDDVLVIYEHILDYAMGLEEENVRLVYAGLHNENPLPSRNVDEKWYLSYADYKYKTLPPFVCGFAVLFSQDTVREIYRASFHVSRVYNIQRQTFPLDDAFVGICAKYAKIQLRKVLWLCYEWPHVKAAVKVDRCVLVKLKAVHGIPGHKRVKVYIDQLKKMTAGERKACQMKNIPLPNRCFK